ncbi:protealysin inhibitor emfourin [Specibacter sp. AOP5-B1-6]|uniref:protealysin inhibitor emfourin n=1 Tax=Specibacter sp. AOP5-B1-6 TaxID=3457653 RepID=UPI00402BB046
MRLIIFRGAGLAGLVARTELDAKSLPQAAAKTFAVEVDRANLREEPPPPPEKSWPDAQLYELCLEEAGPTISVRYSDESLPEQVRLLVAWVDGRPERVESIEP